VVRVLGEVPLDFVIIDLEHGAYGIEGCAALLRAVAATQLYGVVRVPDQGAAMIGKVLDLDADAVLVPQITNAAAAAAAVAAAKFPPQGERGAYPYAAANHFGLDAGSDLGRQNTTTSVWALVEGVDGARNMAEIVRVPGIDVVFVGPVDLSHALGVPWQTGHPLVVERVREIRRVAAESGTAVAVFASHPAVLEAYGPGFQAIACSVDVDVLGKAYRQLLEQLQQPARE
jgi:4-hydroxy-2-oxoheptanedioate aldolase